MGLTPDRRRELTAILSLAAGVFLGLSLLPISLTGPVGSAIGSLLWKSLGVGSALLPLLLLVLGLARFGWLRRLDQRRTAVLMGGLVILVPFTVAIAMGIENIRDHRPNYFDWCTGLKIVGIAPVFIAVTVANVL